MTAARRDRFGVLIWLASTFLLATTLTRWGLWAVTPGARDAGLPGLLWALGIGGGYDLLAFLYFATPAMLVLALIRGAWWTHRFVQGALAAACYAWLVLLVFIAVAEAVFWDEFQARFNFIAVDYLVYTHEVIGNLWQSYPLGWMLVGIVVLAMLLFFATRSWRHAAHALPDPHRARWALPMLWLVAVGVSAAAVDAGMKDRSGNTYIDELAGNGVYQFFAAYRAASLDYDRYYAQRPLDEAFGTVRHAMAEASGAPFTTGTGIERRIVPTKASRRLNIVLVSVESLSAEFSGRFGRSPSLTPRLDALAEQSLQFNRLFASGTRTVRGLEALSLAVPPTPGESIVKRPGNTGLTTLGSLLGDAGYRSMFLYGGYAAFDNMGPFFAGNGYEVYDRTEIDEANIHHETIWGVADEDLYTMALSRFDETHAQGRPFFAHLMTTSNHRPYTFPEGRGPWPQRRRESAVAYSDWALGDFIARASRHPWFADTVFVLTADHCASSGGLAKLPAFRYHIPMWIYAPGHVAPGQYDRLMAQVDVVPTVLGLVGQAYESPFYGEDVLSAPNPPARAYIGTYQLLGYLTDDRLVELSPNQGVRTVVPDVDTDGPQPEVPGDERTTAIAISAYQTAAWRFATGAMQARRSMPPAPPPRPPVE